MFRTALGGRMPAEQVEAFIQHHCGIWDLEGMLYVLYRTVSGGLGAQSLLAGQSISAGKILASGSRVRLTPLDFAPVGTET